MNRFIAEQHSLGVSKFDFF